jgi:hypothetical protein
VATKGPPPYVGGYKANFSHGVLILPGFQARLKNEFSGWAVKLPDFTGFFASAAKRTRGGISVAKQHPA